jgi:hypothetical protein
MTIFTLAFLGTIVTVLVLQPVFKRAAQAREPAAGSTSELEQLKEQKERLLTTLKDLEFEHNAGKLSDADYERVRADDMAQVANIMIRMDQLTGKKVASKAPTKTEAPADTTLTCSACQQGNPPEAKFCLSCGSRFETSVECPKCGKTLPAQAKFCIDCGAKIAT